MINFLKLVKSWFVQCRIHQKQGRDRSHAVSELPHHKESGKNNENLAPCTRKESQRIVKPVALAQNHQAVLVDLDRKMGKGEPTEQG